MSGASNRIQSIIIELKATSGGVEKLIADITLVKKHMSDLVKVSNTASKSLENIGKTMENSMRRAFLGPAANIYSKTGIMGSFKKQFSGMGDDIKKSIEAGMLSMGNVDVNS